MHVFTALLFLIGLTCLQASDKILSQEPSWEDQVKELASPLFTRGMRACDQEMIIEALAYVDQETKSVRGVEDIRDIIDHTLNFIPTIETSAQVFRGDLQTPEQVTGWARQLSTDGFSQVPKEERSLLAQQALTIFINPADVFNKACALENLSVIKPLAKRDELIQLVCKHNIPDQHKLAIISGLSEKVMDDNYDIALQKLPEAFACLGLSWEKFEVPFYAIFAIFTSIEKYPIESDLQQLYADYTRLFPGDPPKDNCNGYEEYCVQKRADFFVH